jgi:hypothetical protein
MDDAGIAECLSIWCSNQHGQLVEQVLDRPQSLGAGKSWDAAYWFYNYGGKRKGMLNSSSEHMNIKACRKLQQKASSVSMSCGEDA